jgi:hypothetical protein
MDVARSPVTWCRKPVLQVQSAFTAALASPDAVGVAGPLGPFDLLDVGGDGPQRDFRRRLPGCQSADLMCQVLDRQKSFAEIVMELLEPLGVTLIFPFLDVPDHQCAPSASRFILVD